MLLQIYIILLYKFKNYIIIQKMLCVLYYTISYIIQRGSLKNLKARNDPLERFLYYVMLCILYYTIYVIQQGFSESLKARNDP